VSDVYKNASTIIATTNQTTLYTVPTADASTVPKQNPVQAIVKSVIVCNTTLAPITLTLVNTDASLGADVCLTSIKAIAASTEVELIEKVLVLENSDILKGTASGAGLHITISVLEISN
jgi:hypothetical protein